MSRKTEMKNFKKLEDRKVKFQGRFNDDVERLLKFRAPRDDILAARLAMKERVERVVQNLGGDRFRVDDYSMWNYAHDIDIAPLELAVIDTQYSQGVPPTEQGETLHALYDHECLATALMQSGLTGFFHPHNEVLDGIDEPRDSEISYYDTPSNHQWPSYSNPTELYFGYQPTLQIHSENNDSLITLLYPASPFRPHLQRYLSTHAEHFQVIHYAVPILLLWLRSHLSNYFTPATITLMFITMLQQRCGVRCYRRIRRDDDTAWRESEPAGRQDGVWFTRRKPHNKEEGDHLLEHTWIEWDVEPPSPLHPPSHTEDAPIDEPQAMIYLFFDWLSNREWLNPSWLKEIVPGETLVFEQPKSVTSSDAASIFEPDQTKWFNANKSIMLPLRHRVVDRHVAYKPIPQQRLLAYNDISKDRGLKDVWGLLNAPSQRYDRFLWYGEEGEQSENATNLVLPNINQKQDRVAKASEGRKRYGILWGQPTYFKYQCLIVADPFLPHYNHARNVPSFVWKTVLLKADYSRKCIKSAEPLVAIFGKGTSIMEHFHAQIHGKADEEARLRSRSVEHLIPSLPESRVEFSSGSGSSSRQPSPTREGGARSRDRMSWAPETSRAYSTQAAGSLEQELRALYHSNSEDDSVWQRRGQTISRVQNVIRQRFGPAYSVACFGSAMYGVGGPSSDLDLVVIDNKRTTGFHPNMNLDRLPDIYNVRLLGNVLERGGFKNVIKVPVATVPIVKFKDPETGIDCDLNVNDRLGLINTQLLSAYCKLFPELRTIILLIKRWAKSHGFNDPSASKGPASFSSYALSLMVIGHLQVAGLLPCLQDGFREGEDGTPTQEDDIFWIRTYDGSVSCDTRFKRDSDWTPSRRATLKSILTGWFRFWGTEFDPHLHISSVRHGRVMFKDVLVRSISKSRRGRKSPVDMQTGIGHETLTKQHGAAVDFTIPSKELTTELVVPPSLNIVDATIVKEGSTSTPARLESAPEGSTSSINAPTSEDGTRESGHREGDSRPPTPSNFEAVPDLSLIYKSTPQIWKHSYLIVTDPFIRSKARQSTSEKSEVSDWRDKNLCQSVSPKVITAFQQECMRAVWIMEGDGTISELFGFNQALVGPRPFRGRGRGRGRGQGREAGGARRGGPQKAQNKRGRGSRGRGG